MMRLICLNCGGYVHFETEVEGLREVTVTEQGLLIEDAIVDDNWNYSDHTLRENLMDVVLFVLKKSKEALRFDPESNRVVNAYIRCARCGSGRVTPPYSTWTPPSDYITLEEELLENRTDYQQLRKEQKYANSLPVKYKS